VNLNPSVEEVPIGGEESSDGDTATESGASQNKARSKGEPDGRYTRLKFPLVHDTANAESGQSNRGGSDQTEGLPRGPLDTGDIEIKAERDDGLYETELKIPPGAVKSFEAARVSGEPLDIVYRPANPDYLLRRTDLNRLTTAASATIGAGLLFFLFAWLIQRRKDD
jgi:hypothetical protein